MTVGEAPAHIELPPLPDRTLDPSIGSTLHHYHREPTWIIHRCTHDQYHSKRSINPRYIMPSTSCPWTGAEDSLLLENIPNTSPCGIADAIIDGQTLTWADISFQMNHQSYKRNISKRHYTEYSCKDRYTAIAEGIEKGSEIEDRHIGANPYATLIEPGAPCQLPAYCGLEDELAGMKVHHGRRSVISGRGKERLPGIGVATSMKRRVSPRVEGPRKRFKDWPKLRNKLSKSFELENEASKSRALVHSCAIVEQLGLVLGALATWFELMLLDALGHR